MDSKLFSIVCFIDDNTVECVPQSWIKNGTCAWPSKPSANARKMIEKHYKPNRNEFVFFKIRVMGSNIKTLEKAKSKARRAQFTSELSADDNSDRKGKKFKRNPPSSTECPIYSDSDGNEVLVIPDNYGKTNQNIKEKLPSDNILMPADVPSKSKTNFFGKGSGWSPSPLKQRSISPKINEALALEISPTLTKGSQLITVKSYCDTVKRNLFGNSPSISKKQWPTLSPKRNKALTVEISPTLKKIHIVSNNTASNKFKLNSSNEDSTINDIEFKKQMLRNIMYLKVELKHVVTNQSEMLEKLQSIEKQLQEKSYQDHKNVQEVNYIEEFNLPINNEDDLNTLEEKILDDQELKNNLVKELSCTGGKNIKSAIKRIMSKLFSNAFLSKYSFTGKKGKNKFCNLFLLPIILKSIKRQLKFKTISDHEIEEPIKTYLAQAPFAEKRKQLSIND